MRQVYVLVYADYGNTCAYAKLEDARDALWQSYMEKFISAIPVDERECYLSRDTDTFNAVNYIEDWGWIDTLTLIK